MENNGSGAANCSDIPVLKAVFEKKIGQPGFNARGNINRDGVENVLDVAFVSQKRPTGAVCQ